MTNKIPTYRFILALLLCVLQVAGIDVYAQESPVRADSVINIPKARLHRIKNSISPTDSLLTDSLIKVNEKNYKTLAAPVDTAKLLVKSDSVTKLPEKKIWIPNSTRAVWLATIFPGAGQIYNRKYWKLPIIYGGFAGCAYALNWNGNMYRDYSQAYLDIMDDDPSTNSFQNFLPKGYDVTSQLSAWQDKFKRKKDSFRRYRDLSIFCFIGVYLISIIDAYVDAELSDFDISKDLGLKLEPSVINDRSLGKSYGVQCNITF